MTSYETSDLSSLTCTKLRFTKQTFFFKGGGGVEEGGDERVAYVIAITTTIGRGVIETPTRKGS